MADLAINGGDLGRGRANGYLRQRRGRVHRIRVVAHRGPVRLRWIK